VDALCAAFEPHRGVDPRTGLSGQQRKIAVLLAQGVTDKQIGEALFLSENTVKSHLRRAYLALGAEMPRALGANLSTMQQMAATIAAADEPRASLRSGLSKRALWQALKPLARQLRGAE